ncbi:hypothetical protein OF83DRAFT_1153289 [Amylostereum chailletii]|nr:hypothetical protein OF83DRAFT_1153289 [Amylostereum chailletii]
MKLVLARTTEEGARQIVWAAIGGSGREDELKGGYVSDADLKEPSDFAISEKGKEAQWRIWDELVDILSKVSPAFAKVVRESLAQ